MSLVRGLKKLFHANPTAFGCDISDRRIHIAGLVEDHGTLTLASFGAHPLPEGVVVNGAIIDKEKAVEQLREACATTKGLRIRTPYVVASLPEPQCFVRIVQLPKLAVEEIQEAIKWEIEANIPLPIAEAYYDWTLSQNDTKPDHLDVLVAAAPKALVESYEAVCREANLKPLAFEIDALSMSRSAIPEHEEQSEATLLIDVAHHRTTFVIHAASLVRFTASVAIAGKDFMGQSPRELAKNLAGYARQYMDFFQTHSAHTHTAHADVQRVLICGYDVYTTGLAGSLSLELGLPVSLANPWANILRPPLRDVPMLPYKDSLGYATALGLALRGYREFADTN